MIKNALITLMLCAVSATGQTFWLKCEENNASMELQCVAAASPDALLETAPDSNASRQARRKAEIGEAIDYYKCSGFHAFDPEAGLIRQ